MENTTAIAHSNIALIKYWGKSDHKLNIPATDSISITLKELFTKTRIESENITNSNQVWLNHKVANQNQKERIFKFLEILNFENRIQSKFKIISENNFPTGAGLASSASGFAALALVAAKSAGLNLTPFELSELARKGSGSAARSIFGGFVHMHRGEEKNGMDAVAEQIYDENYWDLRLLILITSMQEKDIGSTEGMNLTSDTSPYYERWVQSSVGDIGEMKKAIEKKDFEKVGELTEFSCLKMHALAMSANPGLIYWNEYTVKLINKVRALRKKGLGVFFTIDAGPQVKVLCQAKDVKKVKSHFNSETGIEKIIETAIGPSAYIVGDSN
jgi:diphosphomevalonate decarboxylase